MAQAKKEDEAKPKPSNVTVYLPNDNSDNPHPYYTVYFEEGKQGVKSIRWVSPQMLSVQMDDGKIMTFANTVFQYNSYPLPPKKKEPNL